MDSKTDIADTERRMDSRREKYLALSMRGETTRAKTTTFNADQGKDAQRLEVLRKLAAKAVAMEAK